MDDSTITFATTPSTFHALAAQADNGVGERDLTTTGQLVSWMVIMRTPVLLTLEMMYSLLMQQGIKQNSDDT